MLLIRKHMCRYSAGEETNLTIFPEDHTGECKWYEPLVNYGKIGYNKYLAEQLLCFAGKKRVKEGKNESCR